MRTPATRQAQRTHMTFQTDLAFTLGTTLALLMGLMPRNCSLEWAQPKPRPQLALPPPAGWRWAQWLLKHDHRRSVSMLPPPPNVSSVLVLYSPASGSDVECHPAFLLAAAIAALLACYVIARIACKLAMTIARPQPPPRGRAARTELRRLHRTAIVLRASARRSSASRVSELESRLQDAEDRIRVLTIDRDLWRDRATLLDGAGQPHSRLFVPFQPRPTETFGASTSPSLDLEEAEEVEEDDEDDGDDEDDEELADTRGRQSSELQAWLSQVGLTEEDEELLSSNGIMFYSDFDGVHAEDLGALGLSTEGTARLCTALGRPAPPMLVGDTVQLGALAALEARREGGWLGSSVPPST